MRSKRSAMGEDGDSDEVAGKQWATKQARKIADEAASNGTQLGGTLRG